jgi:endoglucanase
VWNRAGFLKVRMVKSKMMSVFVLPVGGMKSGWLLLLAMLALVIGCAGVLRAQTAGDPSATPTVAIKVDQAGYPQDSFKVAIVSGEGTVFFLRRTATKEVVYKGTLSAPEPDADTGDRVRHADFSAFKKPGSYYLEIPGVGRSWNFAIGPDVYERAYYLAMRGFYGQRCGTAVDLGAEFPGYKHPACHLKGEFHISSGLTGERDNVGGWHDAGDYGRYVVNSGFTTGTLLWAWEIYGRKLQPISLRIPESGNGTPDMLSEIRWNLEWMLKMQDADGGAWQKQTSVGFSGFVAPEDDHDVSEVIGTGKAPYKSSCATADLAAVAAIAARVYKPFDAQFAAKNLEAARKGFAWVERNPEVVFRNPQGVVTGEYGDAHCRDEILWAAAELWRTTGEKAYDDYFVANYAAQLPTLDSPPAESWATVGPLALWSYALEKRAGGDLAARNAIRIRTIAAAEAVVERTRRAAYRNSMQTKDYVWGSNGMAAQYGEYLLMANLFAPNRAYVETALDNLHYLLGRNTFSLSWVTQLGENPFQHPHHRPSGSGKQKGPWPGLLSGGPNAGRNDAVTAALPKDTPPARVYADEMASYASNEIAINWQASLVFLLAGVMR